MGFFLKGGVLLSDTDSSSALLRELKEETGSAQYRIIKQSDEKICFEFPSALKEKLGYDSQESFMEAGATTRIGLIYHECFRGSSYIITDNLSPEQLQVNFIK